MGMRVMMTMTVRVIAVAVWLMMTVMGMITVAGALFLRVMRIRGVTGVLQPESFEWAGNSGVDWWGRRTGLWGPGT